MIDGWWHNPEASAALLLGLVAGIWTLLQFRPVARERRRETYQAMASHYAELQPVRRAALKRFPVLLVAAKQQVMDAAQTSLAKQSASTIGRHQPARVINELNAWKPYGIAFTSARETLRSEAKFRCVLWTVEAVREWRDTGVLVVAGETYSREVLDAADTLIHDLNAFLFHYENGGYPARQTLGLLHRSLALASKAMESVVWERSLNARWGRRVLRIGLAAQHFNDVTPQHCTSDLTWEPSGQDAQVIHPRLKRLVLGASLLFTDSPVRPVLLPALRVRVRSLYWRAVGVVSPTPRLWCFSYGGRRLYGHRRDENRLAGLLEFALKEPEEPKSVQQQTRRSLDFSWSLSSLIQEQREAVRQERRERGRFAWLWSPRPASGPSGNE